MASAPACVSVIVPALNEADAIVATLASVAHQTPPAEVIVVDGGSHDGTVVAAQEALPEAMVLGAPRGRARQMNHGAAHASGRILLFLHADTQLPPGALDAIRDALADAAVGGGCFRTTFDDTRNPWMRLWQARLWMRWHRLAFGDRALFVRRDLFERLGGFPDQPIFEDLDLVRSIRREARFHFLDEAVETSARRFQRHGALRQQLRNLGLWTGWLLGLPPHRLKRFYPDAEAERG